jgi:hypothetical protein
MNPIFFEPLETPQNPSVMSRRRFVTTSATCAGLAATVGSLPSVRAAASSSKPSGKAEHCLFLWLGGGMSQIDTFDPKHRGDPGSRQAGSAYGSIPTAVPGVQVTEHLPLVARVMERLTLVRTVNHQTVDEHATATHFVHTGRPLSETIRYPSIGSIVADQLPRGADMPPYVVIGYPNASRDPGFLGPRCGYLPVTDIHAGPAGFSGSPDVDAVRQQRRSSILAELRKQTKQDPSLQPQEEVITQYERLAGSDFQKLFRLESESAALRAAYGGAFGQRCLLARRLVEAGTRFVEVSFNLNFINGTGWDTHNEGQEKQHLLIRELDSALSSLILDLERRDLLDRVLVVVATEFGRPAQFDSGGGRGHHSKCFTMVLGGGGLQHGRAIGVSDELAMKIEDRPVSVPDFLATICSSLGIDPARELRAGNRPVPITDGGKPLHELFS